MGAILELLSSIGLPAAHRVTIAGNLAYIATDAGIQIVDISDPHNPVKRGSADIPGRVEDVKVDGHLAYAAATNGGFRVLDLSNPIQPLEIGSSEAFRPGAVVIRGRNAYVTTMTQVLILDISDPANPVETGSVPISNPVDMVFPMGSFLYTACSERLAIIRVRSGLEPVIIASLHLPFSAIRLRVLGNVIFTTDTKGLNIIDRSNPWAPKWVHRINTPLPATGINAFAEYPLNDHTTIDPEKKLVYIYVSTGGYNPVLNPPTQGTVTLFTSSDWRTGYENICEFILPDVVVQDAAILNGIVYMAASDGLYLAKIHLQWRAPERKSKVRKSSLPGVKAHIPRNDPHQGPPALSTDSDLDFIQNVLGDPLIRGRNLFVRANAGLGQFLNAGSTDRAILEIHRSNGGIRSMDGWKSDFPWYNGRNASISGRESGESWEFFIDGIFLNKSGDYEITCSLFRSGEVVGASSRTITLREPANFKVLFVPLRHNVFSESIDTHSPERTFEDIYNYLKIFPYPSSAIGQQGLDSTYWDIWPEVVTIPDICIGQENGRCTDMFQFDTCGVGNALGDIVREYNSRAAVKANLVMGLLYFSCWYPSGLCEGFGKLAYARIGEYAVVAHEIGHAMGLHRHNDQYLAGEWPCLAYGWDPFNRNYFWVDYSIMETHAAGNCLSSDELEQILQYWGPGALKKPPEVLKRIV